MLTGIHKDSTTYPTLSVAPRTYMIYIWIAQPKVVCNALCWVYPTHTVYKCYQIWTIALLNDVR